MSSFSRFRRVPRNAAMDDRILAGLEEHEVPQVTAALAGLRDLADTSTTPNQALQDVLAGGLGPEQVRAPATPAATPAHRPLRRAFVAKLAGLSLLAQVGVGTAAASVITVGAATTNNLPGPAQDAVAGWVERNTPFNLPDRADRGPRVADDAIGGTAGVDGRDVADDTAPDEAPVDTPAPVQTPPVSPSEEPPGFDVVADTPASERVTPPYEYWRERQSETPAEERPVPADEETSPEPGPAVTPEQSNRPSEHPSGR